MDADAKSMDADAKTMNADRKSMDAGDNIMDAGAKSMNADAKTMNADRKSMDAGDNIVDAAAKTMVEYGNIVSEAVLKGPYLSSFVAGRRPGHGGCGWGLLGYVERNTSHGGNRVLGFKRYKVFGSQNLPCRPYRFLMAISLKFVCGWWKNRALAVKASLPPIE